MKARRSVLVSALTTASASGAILLSSVAPSLPASAETARLAAGTGAPITKQAVAVGSGGAVASDDVPATSAGLEVLRHGGNAVDAAVAVAAALGVADPFVAGIGGGGYLVYYDARAHQVVTIDGRVAQVLRPAERVARQGFPVDAIFREQVRENAARFAQFSSTRQLFLPGGQLPEVGSTFRNPELASTYEEIGRRGVGDFYGGRLGADIVDTVEHLPLAPGATITPRAGLMRVDDLSGYAALLRAPTHVDYRGYDVYGMAPSSSGGTTDGEALNILSNFALSMMSPVQALHHYLESTRLAFADRNRYIGDPAYVEVPLQQMLSPAFGRQRACLINPDKALVSPVAPGDPFAGSGGCTPAQPTTAAQPDEGTNTNHFVVADRFGDVVSYTNTIEQLGGSGIVVPGRGFLLNNELTDFNFTPLQAGVPDPNLPAAGKRPRSSMSPTIVLKAGRPWLAVGSPGGGSIITTVLQILLKRIDFGMTLPEAIAAPRASQRNSATTQAEPAFIAEPTTPGLEQLGQSFAIVNTSPLDPSIKISSDIGAATGLEFLANDQVLAAAEPVRRGGGSAAVVQPAR